MTTDGEALTALQVGQRLGWCERPIQLRADRKTVEVASGDVVSRERTEHYVTCKTRRRADCEPCSRLYAGDAYHLLNAGLAGGKGVSIDVRRSTAVMATLTAPGRDTFGVGHHFRDKHGTRPCHPGPASRRCRHGRRLPADVDTRRTTTGLARRCATTASTTTQLWAGTRPYRSSGAASRSTSAGTSSRTPSTSSTPARSNRSSAA